MPTRRMQTETAWVMSVTCPKTETQAPMEIRNPRVKVRDGVVSA